MHHTKDWISMIGHVHDHTVFAWYYSALNIDIYIQGFLMWPLGKNLSSRVFPGKRVVKVHK
jgi:hypothetical protein